MEEDAERLLTGKTVDVFEEELDRSAVVSRLSGLRFCPLLPLAACIAALGGILFGYDIGIISGAILQLREEFKLTCSKQEAVVTSLLLGGLIASIVGGYLVDKFGRRISIIFNSFIFILGALVLATAHTYLILLFGRLLLGFAVSLSAIGECIYIAEIAPPKRRGLLVSLNELGITFGILLAYFVNYLFIRQSNGWRWMFGLSVIFGVFQAVGMFLLPSSPRWLISHKRIYEAKRVVVTLWPKCDPESEVDRLKRSMNVEKRYRLLDLVRSGDNMRFRMFIGCGLVFLQQVTGQPTVLYYAPAVFQSLGFTSGPAATLATVGLGTVKVLFTVLALLLVDKFGRRRFLLFGIVAMTSSLIVLSIISGPLRFQDHKSSCGKLTIIGHPTRPGPTTQPGKGRPCTNDTTTGASYLVSNKLNCSKVLESFHNRTGHVYTPQPTNTSEKDEKKTVSHYNAASKYLCLLSLMGFVAGYAIGFGPMSWLVLTEIFPVEVKGRAVAIATVFNWGTNIVISSTFLGVIDKIGISKTFAIYSAVASLSLIFVYHFIPETKRRSLEQISAALNERSITCPDKILCCKKPTIVHTSTANADREERPIVEEEVF